MLQTPTARVVMMVVITTASVVMMVVIAISDGDDADTDSKCGDDGDDQLSAMATM
jgi:hypothetical protein